MGKSKAQIIELNDRVDGVGTFEGFVPPLLKPGIYDLKFTRFQTGIFFGSAPKIVIYFEVMEFGDNFQKSIAAYYNVKWVKGRKFKLAFSGNFYRDYCRLFPGPRRLDRIAMSRFEGALIEGRVATVDKTSKGPLPDGAQYSVVRELVGLKQ